MADSAAEFQQKNQAQLDRALAGLDHVGRRFIFYAAKELEALTPGFGNQYPSTRYVPTGRLRGGLNFTRAPIGATSKGRKAGRVADGPFSDYGFETLARIEAQMAEEPMGGISYLENDIAYGHDIVMGSGNHEHIGPRDFPGIAASATNQVTYLRLALQEL